MPTPDLVEGPKHFFNHLIVKVAIGTIIGLTAFGFLIYPLLRWFGVLGRFGNNGDI